MSIQYPCGYTSDYQCDTVDEAKFYDELDFLVATQTAEFKDVQSWLINATFTYVAPEGINVDAKWLDRQEKDLV